MDFDALEHSLKAVFGGLVIAIFAMIWIGTLMAGLTGRHCRDADWSLGGQPRSCAWNWSLSAPIRAIDPPRVNTAVFHLAHGLRLARDDAAQASLAFERATGLARADRRRVELNGVSTPTMLALLAARPLTETDSALWHQHLRIVAPHAIPRPDGGGHP